MSNVISIAQNLELTPAERALFDEVLPVIDEVEERLDEAIDLIVLCMMVRRLASRGMSKDEIIKDIHYHYDHQKQFLENDDENETLTD